MNMNDINQCALKWHVSRKEAEEYIDNYTTDWEDATAAVRRSGMDLTRITITPRIRRRKSDEEKNID